MTPGSGMGKKNQDPDLGSGMNNQDHFSESSETIFWVELKFFDADADPGSGIIVTLDPRWGNSDPG
jgi:hypothetical protein